LGFSNKWFVNSLKVPLMFYLGVILLGLGVDQFANSYIQLTLIYVLVNMILGMSLNLVNGYTGQFSLGHAGFMAVGAYFSAWLSTNVIIFSGFWSFLNFPFYALFGGLLSAVAGFLVGQPSLRLKGDYLAIVTLGFAEIIRVSLLNISFLGGARGFFGIPGPEDIAVGSFKISKFVNAFTHASFWVLVCFICIWRLVRSSHGRAFMSVREDEIAAESIGVNTTQVKIRAFVLSSFFAGVAGSIFAHYANFLNPPTFSFVMSVNAIIIVVLGGMGSLTGSLFAAAFVTILPELLRPLQELTGTDFRLVIYSLCLVLLMILKPSGLLGNKELLDIWRKYVRSSRG
jgi:branched-chain amino acid transport system permease protein